ncbi:MAG TPA: hypothetical protein VLK84_10325 [Longimicrobium sp.]|nr:hypothetical protein [Longimicrobium sp.]
MSLYELHPDRLQPVSETSFHAEGLRERDDLQRLLRDQIEVIAPDTLVLAEEFCDWEDSRRRIDLLCLDRDARLVVVELKATDDGGHMELQALRYAAMVSTLTFEQAVHAHARYLGDRGIGGDARSRILEFLGWDSEEQAGFASDVRIVLASADFSREITTAVLWLNQRDLDIRCVRLRPHRLNGARLLDVQQIVPLPEAEEYQVRVRAKEHEQRAQRREVPADYDSVWRTVEESRPAEEIAVLREVERWFLGTGEAVFALRSGSGFGFSCVAPGGKECYLFKVSTKGQVQVWFQYLLNNPPFTDETVRHALRERLNQVPGVDILPDRIRGKPAFPLALLQDRTAMTAFQQAWEWVMRELQ